jgi:hypothetical protein
VKKLVCTVLIARVAGGATMPAADEVSSVVSAETRGASAAPLSPAAIENHFDRWSRSQPAQRTENRAVRDKKRIGPGTRALIIAGSAAGGFFGGGMLGSKLENTFAPCRCDDPGLLGAVIGAPIGAVAGAVIATLATR